MIYFLKFHYRIYVFHVIFFLFPFYCLLFDQLSSAFFCCLRSCMKQNLYYSSVTPLCKCKFTVFCLRRRSLSFLCWLVDSMQTFSQFMIYVPAKEILTTQKKCTKKKIGERSSQKVSTFIYSIELESEDESTLIIAWLFCLFALLSLR